MYFQRLRGTGKAASGSHWEEASREGHTETLTSLSVEGWCGAPRWVCECWVGLTSCG